MLRGLAPFKKGLPDQRSMSNQPSSRSATSTNPAENPPEMAVVVISVGAPPELERAVASILRQDVSVELVVVNSGGGDVRKWLPDGGKGVRIVESEKLWGPGTARNRGIEASRAPYVAFLAADCEAQDGWVRQRLRHHRDGVPVVASAVVNSHPLSLVAWASHLALFPNRFPGTAANKAGLYGASYDRRIFARHGLFEEIRIGEDSEFHQRIGKQNAPQWVPEVATAHRNVTSVLQAWKDQHRRGLRSGKHWPQIHRGAVLPRVHKKLSRFFAVSRPSLSGRDRVMAMASLPLLVVNFLIFETAANRGKIDPDPVSSRDGKARVAGRAGEWKTALKLWRKSDTLEPGRLTPMLGIASCLMRLERYEAAEAAYAALRDARPQLEAGYLGIAAAAAKTGAWERVLEAWQAVARISPGESTPQYRIATTLLELDQIDEAAELGVSLREEFPSERAGFAVGAAVALRRSDWEAAITCYDHLVFRLNDWRPVPKWAEMLICLDRLADARCLVDRLKAVGAPPKAMLHAAGSWLSASHRWEDLIELFASHRRAVMTDASLLQSHIQILARHGKLTRALALVRSSPLRTPEWRNHLKLIALFRADATDKGLEKFRVIWKRRQIQEFPLALQALILAAAVREEGPVFATALLDRLEKGTRATTQELPWKLTAVFRREGLRCLEALSRSTWIGPSELAPETQVLEILNSRPDARRFSVLTSICRRWQESRHQHPAFFPDPCFVLSDALEVADLIATAIDSGRPLSLVRMGDGEGNLLPYRQESHGFQQTDRLATQRSWWADDVTDDVMTAAKFRNTLVEALTAADVLGIPDLHRACRVIRTNRTREPTLHGKNARGLLAALDFSGRLDTNRMITSCHIHEALAYWGLWDLLLPRAGRISLITCHPTLAGKLAERHGVTIGDVHLIPPERKTSARFVSSKGARHFPDTFLVLREKLATVRPGEVVLVAAGVLGKIYCQWIKQAGGIGLDIGSAADFWCGFGTRGLDEQAAYQGPEGMTDHYRAIAGSDARIARLVAKH